MIHWACFIGYNRVKFKCNDWKWNLDEIFRLHGTWIKKELLEMSRTTIDDDITHNFYDNSDWMNVKYTLHSQLKLQSQAESNYFHTIILKWCNWNAKRSINKFLEFHCEFLVMITTFLRLSLFLSTVSA